MACCVIFYLGIFAYTVAIYPICIHIDNALSNPNCGIGTQVLTWACGIGNVVTDIYLLILPIQPLAQLKMSRKKKIGIWVVFSAGGIVTRLVIVITLQGSKDYLYIAAVENVPTSASASDVSIRLSVRTSDKNPDNRTTSSG
nr:hypothetical protein CFP56_46806 [Quercus suber]